MGTDKREKNCLLSFPGFKVIINYKPEVHHEKETSDTIALRGNDDFPYAGVCIRGRGECGRAAGRNGDRNNIK
jgi:hypothetical protein